VRIENATSLVVVPPVAIEILQAENGLLAHKSNVKRLVHTFWLSQLRIPGFERICAQHKQLASRKPRASEILGAIAAMALALVFELLQGTLVLHDSWDGLHEQTDSDNRPSKHSGIRLVDKQGQLDCEQNTKGAEHWDPFPNYKIELRVGRSGTYTSRSRQQPLRHTDLQARPHLELRPPSSVE